MNTLDLLLLAVGLSMDAFAVSICKGLSLGKINWRHMVLAGLWFGGFQALTDAHYRLWSGQLFRRHDRCL